MFAPPAFLLFIFVVIGAFFYLLRWQVKGKGPWKLRLCGLPLSRQGLTANTLFMGAIGCGKSAGGVFPSIEQLLSEPPDSRTGIGVGGGLFLDIKSPMADLVSACAARQGRTVVNVSPGADAVTFNLIDPEADPAEVAANLWAIVNAVCNLGEAGDNLDFGNEFRRFVHFAVEALRQGRKGTEVTVSDIYEFAGRERAIHEVLHDLPPAPSAARDYFVEFWLKLEGPTKQCIIGFIIEAFGEFSTDPVLKRQFCVPTSFRFRDCSDKGLLVTLSAPPKYFRVARVIGMALKQQFQSMTCYRFTEPSIQDSPLLILAMEEAQLYVTGGDAITASDSNWLALTRQMGVVVIASVQSEDCLVAAMGEEKANVFLAKWGNRVWFMNTSARTNQRAESLLGRVLPSGKPRFAAVDFARLATLESVAATFASGERPAVVRHQNTPNRFVVAQSPVVPAPPSGVETEAEAARNSLFSVGEKRFLAICAILAVMAVAIAIYGTWKRNSPQPPRIHVEKNIASSNASEADPTQAVAHPFAKAKTVRRVDGESEDEPISNFGPVSEPDDAALSRLAATLRKDPSAQQSPAPRQHFPMENDFATQTDAALGASPYYFRTRQGWLVPLTEIRDTRYQDLSPLFDERNLEVWVIGSEKPIIIQEAEFPFFLAKVKGLASRADAAVPLAPHPELDIPQIPDRAVNLDPSR